MVRFSLVALVACLALPVTAFAGGCGMLRTRDDPFDGGVSTYVNIQSPSQLRAVGVDLVSSAAAGHVLTFSVKEGGAFDGQVAAGTSILLRLGDGTTLDLATTEPVAVKPYVAGESVMTLVPYSLPLTDEQLTQFSNSPLTAVRLPLISRATTYDWTPSRKVTKRLVAATTCLLGR